MSTFYVNTLSTNDRNSTRLGLPDWEVPVVLQIRSSGSSSISLDQLYLCNILHLRQRKVYFVKYNNFCIMLNTGRSKVRQLVQITQNGDYYRQKRIQLLFTSLFVKVYKNNSVYRKIPITYLTFTYKTYVIFSYLTRYDDGIQCYFKVLKEQLLLCRFYYNSY